MNFSLSITVVLPLCLYIGIGFLAKVRGLLSPRTISEMNALTYRFLLPLLMFKNMLGAETVFQESSNYGVVVYLFVIVTVEFLAFLLIINLFVKDTKPRQGSIIQGCFCANSILFALPIVTAICGEEQLGVASLCIAFIVPYYTVLSVIVLEAKCGKNENTAKLIKAIFTSPLILGTLAGILFCICDIQLPAVIHSSINTLTSMATPLALVLLGAGLSIQNLSRDWRELALVCICKLILSPLFIVLGAWLLGWRGTTFVTLLGLTCVPTSVSSYSRAEQMGADGELAGEIVASTTILSIVTVFLWVSLLSSAGLLAS